MKNSTRNYGTIVGVKSRLLDLKSELHNHEKLSQTRLKRKV